MMVLRSEVRVELISTDVMTAEDDVAVSVVRVAAGMRAEDVTAGTVIGTREA